MNNNKIFVLSFDLGKSVGISLLSYDIYAKKIRIVKTDTLIINPFYNFPKHILQNHTSRCVNVIVFENMVGSYINRINDKYKIDAFVSEDVFFNPRMIRAYGSLLLYLTKLEEFILLNFNQKLWRIPPTLVKKTFSEYGVSNKIQMADTLATKFSIKKELTEHEVDSIAVGYGFIKLFINNVGYIKSNVELIPKEQVV